MTLRRYIIFADDYRIAPAMPIFADMLFVIIYISSISMGMAARVMISRRQPFFFMPYSGHR